MTQHLIRTLTDSTGHTFTHVIQARENETYQVVEAESKEEAKRKASDKIQCPDCDSWDTVHEFVYENNEPVFIVFECINCKRTYTNYIKKGQ